MKRSGPIQRKTPLRRVSPKTAKRNAPLKFRLEQLAARPGCEARETIWTVDPTWDGCTRWATDEPLPSAWRRHPRRIERRDMPSVPRLGSPIPDPSDGDWTAANGRRWTLTHYDDILTVNKERSTHWSTRSSMVKAWREAFAWLSRRSSRRTGRSVRATSTPCRSRSTLGRQDVGACLRS